MKRYRILSILLAIAFSIVHIITPVFADGEASDPIDNGMHVEKKAKALTDGSYEITLEAYATGSTIISEIDKAVPTDIVLVLDQSGSMGYCMTCNKEMDGYDDYHYNYQPVYITDTPDTSITYYYKNSDGEYKTLYYCSGKYWNHKNHTKGWYTSQNHDPSNYIIPLSSPNDTTAGAIQFYTLIKEQCSSRLTALTNAVSAFVNNVYEKSAGTDKIYGTDDDVNHRISILGFASGEKSNTKYGNTEILSLNSVVNYSLAESEDYYNSLVPVTNVNQNSEVVVNPILVNAINRIAASGATYINLGLEMANTVLSSHSEDYQDKNNPRNKVVIVFTDGSPGQRGLWGNDYGNKWDPTICDADETADATLFLGESLKNDIKATVYTVGIFDGANGSNPSNLPVYQLPTNNSGYDSQYDSSNANRFMHLLSSNYPTATSMFDDDIGSINPDLDGTSYYLSAKDSNALTNIFKNISEQIESGGSTLKLTKDAVVKDEISPQFSLPEGATKDSITLETYKCTGKNGDEYTWSKNDTSLGATALINKDQVIVTGFDFSEHYVGTITDTTGTDEESVTYRGNKLVISFTVVPKPGFLGGNDVYTNNYARLYENSSKAEDEYITEFNRPTVNVPIANVTVKPEDKNVYLLESLSETDLQTNAKINCGTVPLNLSEKNYGLKSWQTKYVDISHSISPNSINSLTGDTTYSISATVSPKTIEPLQSSSGKKAITQSTTESANIYVYKPVIEIKDSISYYGDIAPEYSSNLSAPVWKHGNTLANEPKMGQAPTLSYSYSTEEGMIQGGLINTKNDIPVDVKVQIGEKDVTEFTSFPHKDCAEIIDGVLPQGFDFWIHVKTCSLKITKQGGDSSEPYIFTIFKDEKRYTEASITGNGTVDISELPVGNYTVEEDTDWSWRYRESGGIKPEYQYAISKGETKTSAILSSTNPSSSVTVTNKKTFQYWLNGFSTVVQNIFGKANN